MISWILYRYCRTILLLPHPFAAGNASEELHFGLLAARRTGKRLVVIIPFQLRGILRLPLLDFSLLDIESPYLRFRLFDPRLTPVRWTWTFWCGFLRLLSECKQSVGLRPLSSQVVLPGRSQHLLWMPITKPKSLDWDAVRAMDWPRQFATPLEVSLPVDTQTLGQAALKEMGVPTDGWFACLHVREASTWNDGESPRNSDIGTYGELIDRITAKGGWVIRMGDGSMTPMSTMHNVVDYALSQWKSPAVDLFLTASCRVYVGTPSGILDLASLLDRPRLITNVPEPMWDLSYKPRDFTAHKSMVLVSTGEAVNPLHLLSRGIGYGNLDDIAVLPLSSRQLGSFADQFLKWMDDGFPEIPRDGRSLRYQRQFMEVVDRFADPRLDHDELLLQKFRYASHLYAASPERVFDTWSGDTTSS